MLKLPIPFPIFLMILLVPLALFAAEPDKRQAIVDSLKKIPAVAPQNPDPSSYQDEASAGMFKALKPVPSADEPLDEKRDLVSGWRILLGLEPTEAKMKVRQNLARKSLSLPISIRHSDSGYEVLAGNFTSIDAANHAIDECKRRGFPNATVVSSRVLLDTKNSEPAPQTKRVEAKVSNSSRYWQVQVKVLDSRESAKTVEQSLQSVTNRVIDIIPSENNRYRVRVGRFDQKNDAVRFRDSLRANGYPDAWITVPEQP
ncbi:MAG: SPOR domain-containing protein [bacterium]|nr:SPOR domain-containing protein [bacterium]